MKKMIQSIMLATLLLLGAVAPNTILLTNSHAKEDEASDAISVIGGDMDFKFGEDGTVGLTNTKSDVSSGFKALLNFTRMLSGLGALVMLMVFVLNFIKLGASGTNAKARADAISALVWSGIATACLSMSTVIFFFFFKMKDTVTDDTTTEKKDN